MRLAAAALVFLAAAPALADARTEGSFPSTIIGVGAYGRVVGYPGGDPTVSGVGGELSIHTYPGWSILGVGGFVQLEQAGLDADTDHHLRMTLGAQAAVILPVAQGGFGLGAELGFCYEGSDSLYASGWSAHVSPYLSFDGVVAVSVPLELPISSGGDGIARHFGLGIALALKLPIPISYFK